MLRTVDFDISLKICLKSAWKWAKIPFLETITSSDARIRIPWQNIESRLYTLSTSLGCCSIDIWRYPSSSVILVSLKMAERKSRVFDISIFGGNSLILLKMRGQSVCHFPSLSANVSLFFFSLLKISDFEGDDQVKSLIFQSTRKN